MHQAYIINRTRMSGAESQSRQDHSVPRRSRFIFTFSRVTGVKHVFTHSPAATDAKQSGQDDKHEQHGGEGQGDLLGRGQSHPPGQKQQKANTKGGNDSSAAV